MSYQHPYGNSPQWQHQPAPAADLQRAYDSALAAWMPLNTPPVQLSSNNPQQQYIQVLNQQRLQRLQKYRPTPAKKIASWIALGLGGLMAVSVFLPNDNVNALHGVIISLCTTVLFALPSGYWLWRNKQDQAKITQWMQANGAYRRDLSMMHNNDLALFADPEQLPEIPQRHWWVIWLVVAVAVVVIGQLSPDTVQSPPQIETTR